MRWPRLLLLAVLTTGAVLAAAPVASADQPAGQWTSPASDGDDDGVPVAFVEDKPKLEGWAEFSSGIDKVIFELVEDAADDADEPCSAESTAPDQEVDGGDGIRVNFRFHASFPCNLRYQVRATIVPTDRLLRDDSPQVLDLWLEMALPPAPTTGLTATVVDGDQRAVKLRWDSTEHEPDFLGYEVRRRVDGSKAVRLAELEPGATSYTDLSVPPSGGTFEYFVVGVRSGPEDGTTVVADPGDGATATIAPVPVTQPPSAGGSSEGNASVLTGEGASNGIARVSGGSGSQSGHRVFTIPTPSPPTTADTGFNERLPFGQPAASAPVPPTGDQAVVRLTDDPGDDDTRRQTLLLVAGGSTAFSWAMILRFVSRRAVTLG